MLDSPQAIAFETAGSGVVETRPAERRSGARLRTVYRVARVRKSGDQGFARVLNLSDEGMMLSLSLAVGPGDTMAIDLSDSCSLHGTIVWRNADRCGVRLTLPIDSAQTLKQLFEERREGRARPLRLRFNKRALVCSERGLQQVRLLDISQAGMKVAHDGQLTEGLAVKVSLSAGFERRGVVRWSAAGTAGILLTEILTVDELGSLATLAAGDPVSPR